MRKSCHECRSKSVNVPPSAKTPFFNEKNLDSTPHTPSSDWEKEFDDKFPDGLWDCLPDNEIYFGEPRSEFEEVKTFIRSLLTSQSIKHKAEVEKLEKRIKELEEENSDLLKGRAGI